jgi:putative transposase
MGNNATPSFICEMPLRINPSDERHLLVRLDCARQVYNACLGEALKRLTLLRESAEYKRARTLPKGTRNSPAAKARSEAFRKANEQAGFREYDLHHAAVQFGHSWLGEHLDANTIQKVATRAFLAVQQYAFSKRGKPRFQGKGRFDSVEGKTNKQGILWRERDVRWLGLTLAAVIDPADRVMAHGLKCPVKFVRLVRRKVNGRNRFYAQLVCAGQPFRKEKHKLGQGVVGLDLGPSTMASVSDASARLGPFCAELESKQTEIRKLQRKMDRQRRAHNPGNFSPDGRVKRGVKLAWPDSKRYVRTRAKLAEVHRRQTEHRKSLHGRLVNEVLSQGDVIKLEALSYRAFQKTYGKSVGFRGPGTFVRRLRRKAANAGAVLDEFPTVTTRLSQTCVCGAIEKKPLSLRWHECECGVGPIQRDLFSAWLARCVVNDHLDAGQVGKTWPGDEARLRMASSEVQPAMGQGQPKPNLVATRVTRGQSRSSVQSGIEMSEAWHGAISAVSRELVFQPEPADF